MTGKAIFLVTGATFRFEDVTDVVETEHTISFNYTSMSDGKPKGVVFYLKHIAGHSTYTYGDEGTLKWSISYPHITGYPSNAADLPLWAT